MSKLEELISELCPDGVEYKTVEEIAVDIFRGSGIKREEVTDEGIPCVRYGEIYTTYGVWFDKCVSHTSESAVTSKKYFENGDILFAITGESVEDIAKSCAYVGNEKCLAGGDIVVLKHNQDPKYLSYALSTTEARMQKSKGKVKSKVVHSSVPAIKSIRIPVPPLEVQREIVQILDKFTFLQAELTAELTARQKQYNYYRDLLISRAGGVNGKLIDMLEKPITDGPHTTPQLYSEGIPFISATAVYNGRVHLNDMKGYISKEFDEECSKKYKPQKGDVFMVKSGSTTGKVAYVDFDEDFNVWSPIAAMRTNESNSSRFLFHLLQTTNIQSQVRERMSQGSQPNLSMRVMEKFDVVIPVLEEQIRIAEVLDKLDELCYGINEGLPAEIDARQKQFEFYRSKILSLREVI